MIFLADLNSKHHLFYIKGIKNKRIANRIKANPPIWPTAAKTPRQNRPEIAEILARACQNYYLDIGFLMIGFYAYSDAHRPALAPPSRRGTTEPAKPPRTKGVG